LTKYFSLIFDANINYSFADFSIYIAFEEKEGDEGSG
jgi:hypothetical protein